ncbi:MAG: thiol:disulfide interchange protein [Nostocales cyanobacterium]|nr:MAG: thiol:disulfide interchange protein [Nostocales cyanobacterium]TAF07786.1 MAG: thiol:disulfide interchange protein [Nostocales cyanobacterium]
MSTDTPVKDPSNTESNLGSRVRNFLIVLVAIALSASLFIGLKTQNTSVSLTQLDENSTPLEIAVTNNKPSLVEFYADWCTVCQKMAPDIAELKQQYADKINFVMLNVDNNKWLPEMLKYRVDGIPHFVFLSNQAEGIAEAIGDIPRNIMDSNLEALVAGSPLPYAQSSGKTSQFSAPVSTNNQDDPRSHGG